MRIAFYYSHLQTLGHSMRTFALASEAVRRGHQVLVFNGGKIQQAPEGIDLINVPHPFSGREQFNAGSHCSVDVKTFPLRVEFIKNELIRFKPDVFVSEYFPLGREMDKYSILPVINWLKKEYKCTIISSVGYPLISMPIEKIMLFEKLFDLILIHSPEGVEESYLLKLGSDMVGETYQLQQHVFKQLQTKIVFTGYVFDAARLTRGRSEIRHELGLDKEKLVVVSRGGGAVYPHIITKAIRAMSSLPSDWYMVVVAGPGSSSIESELFRKLIENTRRVRLFDVVSDLPSYLAACDVSVNMSGYNTSLELLRLQKPTVVIPMINESPLYDPEQGYRALILKDFLGAEILDYHKFNSQELAENILEVSNRETKPLPSDWLQGAEKTLQIIEGVHSK